MRNLPQFLGFEEKMRVGYPIFGCGPLMTECDLLEAYAPPPSSSCKDVGSML